MADGDLRKLYYWLNAASLTDSSTLLRRDMQTRAIERFFLDWTLHPSNDGRSPGYMRDLPALYSSAQPGTILWHAVRAIAFAGLRDHDSGSFAVKARESYGLALTRMRLLSDDGSKLVEDRILAALLLIDAFEKIHLSRQEPLGPHKDAIRHILALRGEEQFQSQKQFELWRAAQQRLQAQRIAQRDGPDDEQLEWISKLNVSLPDLHVCVDVEKMVVLCSAARKVVQDGGGKEIQSAEGAMRAKELLETMREIVASMDEWSRQVDAVWLPRRTDADPAMVRKSHQDTKPSFRRSQTLEYSDPWLAYKWNFHNASQIVLRQSMVEVMEYLSNHRHGQAQAQYQEEIAASRTTAKSLANTIIESCIPLLGFSKDSQAYPRGKMVRRFFALCAISVVQQARFASPEQKQTAKEVLDWIERSHRLP